MWARRHVVVVCVSCPCRLATTTFHIQPLSHALHVVAFKFDAQHHDTHHSGRRTCVCVASGLRCGATANTKHIRWIFPGFSCVIKMIANNVQRVAASRTASALLSGSWELFYYIHTLTNYSLCNEILPSLVNVLVYVCACSYNVNDREATICNIHGMPNPDRPSLLCISFCGRVVRISELLQMLNGQREWLRLSGWGTEVV